MSTPRPGTRILFLSGYVKEEYDRPGLEQRELITKPFSLPDLARRIRTVLDRGKPDAEHHETTWP